MTRQCRSSANILLRTAEEASPRPRRCAARPVPRRTLPRRATLEWHLPGHPWASAPSARAGLGARAASTRSLRHGVIAICTAHVLNSLRAPTASLTGKLTRHEQRPNRGPNRRRCCAKAGNAAGNHRRQSPRERRTTLTGCRRGSDRAELRGSASSSVAPLP